MKKYFILAGFIIALAVGFIVWDAAAFSPEKYVAALEANDLTRLRREIPDIARTEGPTSAVATVALAVQLRRVSLDDCHLLLHLIGHQAYQVYGNDYDALLAANKGKICLGGYVHGVEGEISAEGTKEDLFTFCALIKERKLNNGPCYHGTGHSIFERTHDIRASLQFCDSLAQGPENDLTDCYRGVFSEVGNQMNGVDTNTGLSITALMDDAQHIDPAHPYALCQTFSEQYANSCYSQIAKLFYQSTKKVESILRCAEESPTLSVRRLCITILAGVATRHLLDEGPIDGVASFINTLPPLLQLEALAGVKESYGGAQISDITLAPWHTLCEQAEVRATKAACHTL